MDDMDDSSLAPRGQSHGSSSVPNVPLERMDGMNDIDDSSLVPGDGSNSGRGEW